MRVEDIRVQVLLAILAILTAIMNLLTAVCEITEKKKRRAKRKALSPKPQQVRR